MLHLAQKGGRIPPLYPEAHTHNMFPSDDSIDISIATASTHGFGSYAAGGFGDSPDVDLSGLGDFGLPGPSAAPFGTDAVPDAAASMSGGDVFMSDTDLTPLKSNWTGRYHRSGSTRSGSTRSGQTPASIQSTPGLKYGEDAGAFGVVVKTERSNKRHRSGMVEPSPPPEFPDFTVNNIPDHTVKKFADYINKHPEYIAFIFSNLEALKASNLDELKAAIVGGPRSILDLFSKPYDNIGQLFLMTLTQRDSFEIRISAYNKSREQMEVLPLAKDQVRALENQCLLGERVLNKAALDLNDKEAQDKRQTAAIIQQLKDGLEARNAKRDTERLKLKEHKLVVKNQKSLVKNLSSFVAQSEVQASLLNDVYTSNCDDLESSAWKMLSKRALVNFTIPVVIQKEYLSKAIVKDHNRRMDIKEQNKALLGACIGGEVDGMDDEETALTDPTYLAKIDDLDAIALVPKVDSKPAAAPVAHTKDNPSESEFNEPVAGAAKSGGEHVPTPDATSLMNQAAANSNVDPSALFDLKPPAAPFPNTKASPLMNLVPNLAAIPEDSFGLAAAPVANAEAASFVNHAPVAAAATSSDVGEANLKSPPKDMLSAADVSADDGTAAAESLDLDNLSLDTSL